MPSVNNSSNIPSVVNTVPRGTGTGFSTIGYTSTPTASSIPTWDTHSNLSSNSFIKGYATTATAAGTTTLTVSSAQQQFFTGTTTQTVVMPVTSTLVLGQSFTIFNNSTGIVTVQSSGGNTIQAMVGSTTMTLTVILTSGTTAASWDALYLIDTALTLPLALSSGGTNASLTASNGGIFYSTATAGAILSGTATARQMLQSGTSAAPAWSTSTWPATTTANQILYSSATNTVGEITTANNGVLITSNSGVPSLLANSGTPGYVLSANTSAPPSWVAPYRTLISTQAASSSASITFTSGITGYSYFVLEILNCRPATGGAQLQIQFSNDGGSTWATTGYQRADITLITGGSVSAVSAGTSAVICSTANGDAASNALRSDGVLNLYNLTSNNRYSKVVGTMTGYEVTTTNQYQLQIYCYCSLNNTSSSPVNAIKIFYSSGNINAGTFNLYGVY